LACEIEQARDMLIGHLSGIMDALLDSLGAKDSLLTLEQSVALHMTQLAQHVLAFVFAKKCQDVMLEDLKERKLEPSDIRLRSDSGGYITVSTTFGPITFPTFAYRDESSEVASVTRHPARKLFPFHKECHSSPLCLEWESLFGAQHPFRKAEDMLHFFTRGASTVEDTTICRHMLALSQMIEPEWLYHKPENIRHTLQEQATCDKTTGRPLIYVSSDAHALRRYIGGTWDLQWKMVNGIRVWCEDAQSGAVIHLGGEFTWGDCHVVEARIRELVKAGILPNNDPEWTSLDAQMVFVSDGSAWLVDHLVPHLAGVIVILDLYHLIDWFTQFSKIVFTPGSQASRKFHNELQDLLFKKRRRKKQKTSRQRRGHRKQRRQHRKHAHDRHRPRQGPPKKFSSDFTARTLLDFLAEVDVTETEHQKALQVLAERISHNTPRINYAEYFARGLQIGSGAMESLHRNGSQQRLKLPGARWLEDSSQAVLQFRMLELSGRWREFWDRPDIASHIAQAFAHRASKKKDKNGSKTKSA